MKYEVLFLQFTCCVIVTLEEAQDGHVTKGMGVGVTMVGNQMVVLIGECRAQMLRELVTEPALGLSNVEETTSGAMDTVDQIGGYTDESLLDLETLFGALDR
eukprot:g40405.t1